jgi:hypothetical protein
LELADRAVHHRQQPLGTRNGQRAPGKKITLQVDDHKCIAGLGTKGGSRGVTVGGHARQAPFQHS